ncbi:conserved hypothetical protein [Altererythrobacter sp. B11]|uniref:hypothetical protein n=1 Tax=Altererythrobacter sp. B11 TaxID=2060312 RepID=UPI000DC6E4AC|nr:hypothetical protein [Altererythrobacter sp. B11]BBC72548.1 conserved hypothetical protein [Altererythrobacter sp. B11]
MKTRLLAGIGMALALGLAAASPGQAADKPWYKQPWDPANVKPCDRACLVGIMDGYLAALQSKDMSSLPLAEQVIATENTGKISIGTGLFWRARMEPTSFRITVADPVQGQVAVQSVMNIDGRTAMVAIRLRVERNMITEAEHFYDRNVAPEAMELLTTPRPTLLADVPKDKRMSREFLTYAAESYFDALTGEDGSIAPFADECVRYEQGYQTVNNKQPGRASPTPRLPDPNTEMGRFFIKLSTMTCKEQVDTGVFGGIKRIWPHRALVVDEQKGLVATFPFFVHDGVRETVEGGLPRPQDGAGMVLNLTTMETFGIRDGKIYEVEAFPFVTIPYGTNDGWTHADPN